MEEMSQLTQAPVTVRALINAISGWHLIYFSCRLLMEHVFLYLVYSYFFMEIGSYYLALVDLDITM